MLNQSWLRLAVSLLIGVTAVCALAALGQLAAANGAAAPVRPMASPAVELPARCRPCRKLMHLGRCWPRTRPQRLLSTWVYITLWSVGSPLGRSWWR
jgi:hypothetical protein